MAVVAAAYHEDRQFVVVGKAGYLVLVKVFCPVVWWVVVVGGKGSWAAMSHEVGKSCSCVECCFDVFCCDGVVACVAGEWVEAAHECFGMFTGDFSFAVVGTVFVFRLKGVSSNKNEVVEPV